MVEHSSFSGHSPNSDYSPYNHDIRRLFSDGLNAERLRGYVFWLLELRG